MPKNAFLLLTASILLLGPAYGRTWTDTAGKTIEAEMVAIEGDKVVVKLKNKDVKLPLARLSEDDRKFVEEWQRGQPPADGSTVSAAAGELKLCGKPLQADGKSVVIEEALPPEVLKAYSKAKTKPAKLKLKIALPTGFDPAKPQSVMWVSAAINDDAGRKSGNTGIMDEFRDKAIQAGWVVIAADTDVGNPIFAEEDRSEDGDMAVHKHVVAQMQKEWPASKTWKYACCGFSGGAKGTFIRAGQLLEFKLDVIGMFLGGCNEDWTEKAQERTGVKKSAQKKLRVFISNGKQDTISTIQHAEKLRDNLEGQDYSAVEMDLFEGPHTINQESYAKGLAWLKEPAKK